jgi:hypothetical protein
MVGRARFLHLSGHSVRLCSFVGKPQLNDNMVAYFAPPEQIRYEDGVEYVEIELGPGKAKLGTLRESLWK